MCLRLVQWAFRCRNYCRQLEKRCIEIQVQNLFFSFYKDSILRIQKSYCSVVIFLLLTLKGINSEPDIKFEMTLVFGNCSSIIFRNTVIGMARINPGIPQMNPQNISIIKMVIYIFNISNFNQF